MNICDEKIIGWAYGIFTYIVNKIAAYSFVD